MRSRSNLDPWILLAAYSGSADPLAAYFMHFPFCASPHMVVPYIILLHTKFIDIESYLSYLKILEVILTHISERLLHITLDCCYISHWTVVRHLIAYCDIL